MREVQIEGVLVQSDGTSLTLIPEGNEKHAIRFSAAAIGELIEFVTSIPGGEHNRRRAFRVPVWTGSGLEVELTLHGRSLPGEADNISYTGLHFRSDSAAAQELDTRSEVRIHLRRNEIHCEIGGIVQYRDRRGCGIRFTTPGGHATASQRTLERLVMELQRDWLSTCLQPAS